MILVGLDKILDHHRLIRDALHAKRVQLHFIGSAGLRHSIESRANQFAGHIVHQNRELLELQDLLETFEWCSALCKTRLLKWHSSTVHTP